MIARTKMICCGALACLTFGLPLLADILGKGVVFDRQDEDLRDVAVVGSHFMNIEELRHLASEMAVSKAGTAFRVLIITAFANSDDAGQTLSGKGRTDISYAEVIERIHAAHQRAPLAVARLISINGNTVVEKTDGEKILRFPLTPIDPTIFQTQGLSCELLEIYFHRLPRSIRSDGHNPVLINVYIRSNRFPLVTEAEDIMRTVQRLIGHKDVSTHIRTDTWFLEDGGFPLWYPFSKSQVPPSFSEFRSRGEMYCLGGETKLNCKVVQFP